MDEFLTALVASGITALATWGVARRQIKARYITAERTKWRGDIRRLTLKIRRAILDQDQIRVDELKDELRIRLNPSDPQDKKILCCMKVGSGTEKFVGRIALLLKHDWERVKLESGFPFMSWFVKPRRLELGERVGTCCLSNYEPRWCGIVGLILGVLTLGVLLYFCPLPRWCPWGC